MKEIKELSRAEAKARLAQPENDECAPRRDKKDGNESGLGETAKVRPEKGDGGECDDDAKTPVQRENANTGCTPVTVAEAPREGDKRAPERFFGEENAANDSESHASSANGNEKTQSRPAEPSRECEDLPRASIGDAGAPDATENERLRAELEGMRRRFAELERGYAELIELFPGADLSKMPDSFSEAVSNGVPPAAAYALELRRREVFLQKVASAAESASASSAGKLGGASDDVLSPAEVRAMSRDEVKRNYSRIMESMKRWN